MRSTLVVLLVVLALSTGCSWTTPLIANAGARANVRRGTATSVYICGIRIYAAGGIADAALDGSITHIATVDEEVFSILVYSHRRVIVSGEDDSTFGKVHGFAVSAEHQREPREPTTVPLERAPK